LLKTKEGWKELGIPERGEFWNSPEEKERRAKQQTVERYVEKKRGLIKAKKEECLGNLEGRSNTGGSPPLRSRGGVKE